MKKKILICVMILSIGFVFANDEDQVSSLEKKVKELEKEIDLIKRDANDNAVEKEQLALQKVQWGTEPGFEIFGFLQGGYSGGSIGFVFPKIQTKLVHITMGLRATYFGGFVPITVTDSDGTLYYTPMLVTGSFWMTYGSPLLFNFMKFYGGFEINVGHTFSPTDVNRYKTNVTVGGVTFGGIEFFTSKWASVFLEVGGGPMSVITDSNNSFVKGQPNQWYGSGFMMRMGSRFFIATKK